MTKEHISRGKKASVERETHPQDSEARRVKAQALGDALFREEAPLVADLRLAGFDADSAWSLFNRKEPGRLGVPIPSYREAIPILLEHLGRGYNCSIKEGIVRALTVREARHALDVIVAECRRTEDPAVATDEIQRAFDVAWDGAGSLWEHGELHAVITNRWNSYRFAITNAIVFHFQQEHIPLIAGLIRTQPRNREHWKAIAKDVRRKLNRWKWSDDELLHVLEEIEAG